MVDDDLARRAVELADPVALRVTLVHLTRDPALAAMVLEPAPAAPGGLALSDADTAEVRARALELLRAGVLSVDVEARALPPDTELRALMELVTGRPLTDREFAYQREEVALEEFPRAVGWTAGRPAAADSYSVAIVGAGVCGIVTAIQLERLGIPYTVYERRSEVGGTWSVNTYPDARVDTSSFMYQYNFEKNYPWSEFFARQDEVRRYLEHVAKKYGVLDHVELDTDVRTAVWDEEASRWRLEVGHDGEVRTVEADVVVAASGLFNAPKEIDIPGVETFEGELYHTTEWPYGKSVAGRSVAVIGNGSTGVQLLAPVAAEADRVHVFQRTPQWISPRAGYGDPIPPETRWLLDTLPFYWNWFCYTTCARVIPHQVLQEIDREHQRKTGGFSRENDAFREVLVHYIRTELGDRQDLLEHLVPPYPPMARRMIVDNGWYRALRRDTVELVTDGIERITRTGVRTVDGREREVDVILAAVGFAVTKYCWPTTYEGRGGVALESRWEQDGPRAYLGMAVPGFPNLFLLYGPNAQPRSGALVSWMETWARYVVQGVVDMIEGGHHRMEVREEAFERYNADLDAATADLIWEEGSPAGHNYYVNRHGRQQVNAPWRTEDYFALLARPEATDFDWS
jgi:4-hydroxyacetophenone monooxygenase